MPAGWQAENLVAALIFCLPAVTALASEQSAEQEEIETLVISAPSSVWAAAGSVSFLGQEDLKDASFTHPYESFARIPGIWISRGSGQEHLTAIRSPVLTGPGACGAFLLLEDGIPVRPMGFCNVNGLFETTLELASGLEVVRGPAAATFGGNALHGAINVRFDDSGQRGNDYLKLTLGPWQYGGASFGWARQGGDNHSKLAGFIASEDGYREQAGYDLQKLRFAQGWVGGDGDSTKIAVSAVNLQQETAGYLVGEDAWKASESVRRTNANPEAFRDGRALRLTLEHSSGEDSVATLRAWARGNDMTFLMHFLPCTPLEQNDHVSMGASWQRNHRSERGEITWGVFGEAAQVHLAQSQQKPQSACGFVPSPQGPHYDYRVTSNNLSVWAHGGHALKAQAEEQATRLLWDVRVEQLAYDYHTALPAGPVAGDAGEEICGTPENLCRYSRPADGIDRFALAGGRVSLAFAPDGWRWHLALASGYRPPQIGELYRLQQGQLTADLKPEQLLQLEWGGGWEQQTVQLQWALFAAVKNNFIFRDSDRFIQPGGKTEQMGAELTLSTAPTPDHRLNFHLTLADFKYAFDAATPFGDISSGNQVDTAPAVLTSLLWQWHAHRNSALMLETELLHTSSYYTDASNEHSYPGHTLLNLRLSMTAMARLNLHLRLHNALNKKYADRADYSAFSGERYFPGQPRTLYLSVQWLLAL